jgi:hypothetical protein
MRCISHIQSAAGQGPCREAGGEGGPHDLEVAGSTSWAGIRPHFLIAGRGLGSPGVRVARRFSRPVSWGVFVYGCECR